MNFKIAIMGIIFLTIISCSTIKYENREEFIQIAINDSLDRLLSKCFIDETSRIK